MTRVLYGKPFLMGSAFAITFLDLHRDLRTKVPSSRRFLGECQLSTTLPDRALRHCLEQIATLQRADGPRDIIYDLRMW